MGRISRGEGDGMFWEENHDLINGADKKIKLYGTLSTHKQMFTHVSRHCDQNRTAGHCSLDLYSVLKLTGGKCDKETVRLVIIQDDQLNMTVCFGTI